MPAVLAAGVAAVIAWSGAAGAVTAAPIHAAAAPPPAPLAVPVRVRGELVDTVARYCQQGTPLQVA